MRLALIIFLGSFAFPPEAVVHDRVVLDFETRYRSARTLAATFLQTYRENGRVVRVESGKAFFRRPGRMRWEYEKPEQNVFLVDGKYSWFYAPADHSVIRVPARESEDWRTPLALLAGEMKLARVCAAIEASSDLVPLVPEHRVFRCIVRSDEPEKASPGAGSATPRQLVLFELSADGELARLLIRDPGGVEVEFQFKNWERNPALAESLFHFSPPPGVAIVDGVLPTPGGVRQ